MSAPYVQVTCRLILPLAEDPSWQLNYFSKIDQLTGLDNYYNLLL